MRLIIHGATGRIGKEIVAEALGRGHTVTAFVRDPACRPDERVAVHVGDVLDADQIAETSADHDAVISAIGWTDGQPEDLLAQVAQAMVTALRGEDKPVIVVGGAGTLMTESGLPFFESPEFPAERKANSAAQAAALEVYRQAEGVPWTYLCPPAVIAPGPRIGTYRLGARHLLRDNTGQSRISLADFAFALIDILEGPVTPQGHFTVAY